MPKLASSQAFRDVAARDGHASSRGVPGLGRLGRRRAMDLEAEGLDGRRRRRPRSPPQISGLPAITVSMRPSPSMRAPARRTSSRVTAETSALRRAT